MADRLLKTGQVAELLAQSDSSVKRLVNAGALRAVRTQGGHRLIPESEVRAYLVRQRGAVGLVGDLPVGAGDPVRLSILVEALLRALRAGDAGGAREVIGRACVAGFDGARLADDLIRPVMARIGDAWQQGEMDVYEEHRASRIVESALVERIRCEPPAPRRSPLAMGAAPAGDPYTISGLLCELSLRQLGWDVVNLGPNLPLASLAKAVREHEPRLVWLSVHWVPDREAFVSAYGAFFGAVSETATAVILGGPALDEDLRGRMVAAGFGDRMSHLREFARRLAPRAAVAAVGDGSGSR